MFLRIDDGLCQFFYLGFVRIGQNGVCHVHRHLVVHDHPVRKGRVKAVRRGVGHGVLHQLIVSVQIGLRLRLVGGCVGLQVFDHPSSVRFPLSVP